MAETLAGRVVGISDGDTLTVLVEKRQVKVRINGIDAPEKEQAFAEQSKQNLSRMAFQKDARLSRQVANPSERRPVASTLPMAAHDIGRRSHRCAVAPAIRAVLFR